MNEDEYLETRVDGQLSYYEQAAGRAKSLHLWIQSVVITLGLLVPVLANLPERVLGGGGGKTLAITCSSLLLAILTGLANFRKFGDLWLSYRTTEELLKKERALFLTRAGTYKGNDAAFSEFVERVESIVSVEHERFRAAIESAQRPTTGPRGGSGGGTASAG